MKKVLYMYSDLEGFSFPKDTNDHTLLGCYLIEMTGNNFDENYSLMAYDIKGDNIELSLTLEYVGIFKLEYKDIIVRYRAVEIMKSYNKYTGFTDFKFRGKLWQLIPIDEDVINDLIIKYGIYLTGYNGFDKFE